MLAPNDGLATTITDIIYVYIKSEFPETLKIYISAVSSGRSFGVF